MWALRRASNPLKGREAFIIRIFQNSYSISQVASRNLYDKASNGNSHMAISDRCTCLKSSRCTIHGYAKLSLGWCSFSSQADSNNSTNEEDELEDAFSELENPLTESEKENRSESDENDACEGTKEPQDGLLVSELKELKIVKKVPKKKVSSALFNAIVEAPRGSVQIVLDKWVENGNELNQSETSEAMFNLRLRKMFERALQFSEWLESQKHTEFGAKGYASRLDLIAKVHGLHAAESYIHKIPESSKDEITYRTFLAICVKANNIKKSEEVFKQMKGLGFPLSSFSCNQLLLLYKKTDKKKVTDVLLLMEKEGVKPTLFTYGLLINMKGEFNDISGMEQIVETMKTEGVKPNFSLQAAVARFYVNSGLKEKAESVMREMEGDDLRERKWVCNALLPLYGSLGKENEVVRIWKVCQPNPRLEDCISATIAWGRLGNIKKAEEAFERVTKISKNPKHYSVLLRVYANHKMVKKGNDLVTRMAESEIVVGPHTWDDLVRLYLFAGKVEKADSFLQNATQQMNMKPLISSYMAIMDRYAKNGDIHNTEKIFYKMRQAGYTCQLRHYEPLIRAYMYAKVPAYGIRERLKGDNIFPNNIVMGMLEKVDPFRKTLLSDLID